MEPPMSNSSMSHQDPDLDFDDTRIILQGASCTIAARACTKFSVRCDGTEMNILVVFGRRTLAKVASHAAVTY
jgi:hypothetical protein